MAFEMAADGFELHALAAVEAFGIARVAVQLDHLFIRYTRVLMKVVNVLRDDVTHSALRTERCYSLVAVMGFGLCKRLLHRKAPAPRFAAHLGGRHEVP